MIYIRGMHCGCYTQPVLHARDASQSLFLSRTTFPWTLVRVAVAALPAGVGATGRRVLSRPAGGAANGTASLDRILKAVSCRYTLIPIC
jgi:hypothetical protein